MSINLKCVVIREKIEDLVNEKQVVLVNEIIYLFILELEDLKKEMEGCTGEDCLYPIEKRLNELKV